MAKEEARAEGGKGKEAMGAGAKKVTLEKKMEDLDGIFKLEKEMMEKVVKKMVDDMEDGLRRDNADMKMLISHFDPSRIYSHPSSAKCRHVYALDLGGTNARALCVKLDQQNKEDVEHGKPISEPVSGELKEGSLEELFEFLAKHVIELIKRKEEVEEGDVLVKKELGFCFSFPTSNTSINVATLTNWTKEFNVKGAEGKDLVQVLQESFGDNSPVTVTALVNDTVGTLAIGHFLDEKCVAGVIFGTGTNAAYVEDINKISTKKKDINNITKANDTAKRPSQASHKMVINTEWGNFNPPDGILTEYDIVDASTSNANNQVFEKMISGKYLGHIVGKVLQELATEYSLFRNKPTQKEAEKQEQSDAYKKLGTEKVNQIHDYPYCAEQVFKVEPLCSKESKVVGKVCKLVVKRAGRLSAAAIVAILTKLEMFPVKEKYDEQRYPVNIAVDGTMYVKYGKFKKYLMEGLEELVGEDFNKIVILTQVKDGSGIGTAIIAGCYANEE